MGWWDDQLGISDLSLDLAAAAEQRSVWTKSRNQENYDVIEEVVSIEASVYPFSCWIENKLDQTKDDIEKLPSQDMHFVVVRAQTDVSPTVRLQSDPMRHGLIQLGYRADLLQIAPDQPTSWPNASKLALIFHYNDVGAIAALRTFPDLKEALLICLGSDIYSFDQYVSIHDIVDFYVVPSHCHRQTLSYQVYKPVYVVPEAVDPIAVRPSNGPATGVGGTPRQSKRLLWFGYAESFPKSMITLLPVIERALKAGWIDDFGLIVDEHRFPNRFQLSTQSYDTSTFAQKASAFDYCILSHFSLDLTMNSYIKSSNKAITSLALGLIPITSTTPNYLDLMKHFGLDRFTFSSADDLGRVLESLNPSADQALLRQSNPVGTLRHELAPVRIAEQLLSACWTFQQRGNDVLRSGLVPATLTKAAPATGLKDHLADLVPSFVRALKLRLPAKGKQAS